MALDPTLDTLDDLPEAFHEHYAADEKNGGFKLQVNAKNGYELSDTTNLKSALGKERARASELEKRSASFGDLDAEEIRTKLSEYEELKQIDPSKEADKMLEARMKSLQEQMNKKHQGTVDQLKGELDKTKTYLRKVHIDDKAKSAIIAAGGNEKTMAYMLPSLIGQLSVQETENGFITQVRDGEGHPRIGDSNGSAMTVEQLVLEMKSNDLWSDAFPGSSKSGGGMPANTQGGTPRAKDKTDTTKLTNAEKSKLIAENPGKWMEILAAQR